MEFDYEDQDIQEVFKGHTLMTNHKTQFLAFPKYRYDDSSKLREEYEIPFDQYYFDFSFLFFL
jgi:hypothetical protein